MKKFLNYFSIIETKPLHKNILFWIATLTPILIGVLLSIPITKNLSINFSEEGYKLFLEKFSFPLWFSSSSIILGVIVARFHSSAQKATSIIQSKLQNNFSNYLSHRDHFQKHINAIAEEFDIKIDAFKIYGIVFSESTPSGVSTEISSGIYEYYEKKFTEEFWLKMKVAAPNFYKTEVDIYFPRFAKSIGINFETKSVKDYEELKSTLIRIRKLYRRAMEYGLSRHTSESSIEIEEHGFSQLIGDFDLWSQKHVFKQKWSGC